MDLAQREGSDVLARQRRRKAVWSMAKLLAVTMTDFPVPRRIARILDRFLETCFLELSCEPWVSAFIPLRFTFIRMRGLNQLPSR